MVRIALSGVNVRDVPWTFIWGEVFYPMHRSRSGQFLIGAILATTILSPLGTSTASAQQRGVRTIKDFPERLNKERQTEFVPRKKTGVRTAADFERARDALAKREAAEAQEQAAAGATATGAPVHPQNLGGKKVPEDLTSYVFRIPGADLVRVATQAGATFSPKGGKPVRGGGNGAFQMKIHPGAMTSLVRGHIMTQLKPHDFWVIKSSSNQFHMFMDANGNPLKLRKGWSIQQVVLKGKNYKWVKQPKKGGTSPYFVVELTAYHHANTVVEIAGAVLTGPEGVTQWEQAFLSSKELEKAETKPAAKR